MPISYIESKTFQFFKYMYQIAKIMQHKMQNGKLKFTMKSTDLISENVNVYIILRFMLKLDGSD